MKRKRALLLIIFMLFSVCPTVFAETHTITIENSVTGETYKAYKIFDVTYSGVQSPADNQRTSSEEESHAPDNSHEHLTYAYTIDVTPGTNGAAWWDVVTADDNKVVVTADKDFYANGLHFTLTSTANRWNVEQVETAKTVTVSGVDKNVAAFDAAKFAALLYNSIPVAVASSPDGTGTGNGKTGAEALKITVGADGYYFVTTSLGSLCALNTTEPNAIIVEKNSVPSVDKGVSDKDSDYGKEADVSIGDTVYFKIDITDGIGTDSSIILHDTMSAGLTLNRKTDPLDNTVDTTFEVKVGAVTVNPTEEIDNNGTPEERTNYTVRYKGNASMADTDCTFEIVFSDAYIKSLADSSVITVKYTATLNKDAPVFNAETVEGRAQYSTNKAKIDYSQQHSTEIETKVYTYDMGIIKTDINDNGLANAKFKLSKDATDIEFIKVNDNEYRVVTAAEKAVPENASKISTELITPANGKLKLVGLDAGTYSLTETVPPASYNPLTQPITVVIGTYTDNTVEGNVITAYKQGYVYTDATKTTRFSPTVKTETLEDTVEVENRRGSELPSTGGIGTYILYIAGTSLIVAAVILIIVKKRRISHKS